MTATEKLFSEHSVRLQKIAHVFAYKSRGTIDREDFYQEFAVRLLELNNRYTDKTPGEFAKIVNFSLHNLACDMLKNRFRLVYTDNPISVTKTVIAPSFLYFYKQAAHRLIRDAKAVKVFDWLVANPDVVEKIREEKNIVALRARKLAFSDIVEAVSTQFDVVPHVARRYLRLIKNCLKQAWALEGCL